ncbi:hypothetical protein ALQ16_204411 [Pseudomonas syringae pv. actinidiae]|nr:hypothetical protein ALQ16_204411 [Pseudomonas syringae pv. actinidiae]RMS14747.1 hypothetical protein ALP75_200833 [Pseudomonas syringae pv. actinidiae]RMS58913.1 hypothetical protein ALP64_201434 [Pseudomonas syringae pv. actinidiae]
MFGRNLECVQLAALEYISVAVGAALQAIDIFYACIFPAFWRCVPALNASFTQANQARTIEVEPVSSGGRRGYGQAAIVV